MSPHAFCGVFQVCRILALCGKDADITLYTTAECLSLDNLVKIRNKATVTDSAGNRDKPLAGGVIAGINEDNMIVTWVRAGSDWAALTAVLTLVQIATQSAALDLSSKALGHLIKGVAHRNTIIDPAIKVEFVVTDNCCSVRNTLQSYLPNVPVLLDFWHFQQRYQKSIWNKTKNPLYKVVGAELCEAIMSTRAIDGKPAVYRPKPEQAERLVAVYDKYLALGDVWTDLSQRIHQDQLRHVNNGCFGRPTGLEHLPADSSRNESMHHQWNNLQRGVACGLNTFLNLSHDFVHRRNCRIAKGKNRSAFINAAQGSHHLLLVDATLKLLNRLSTPSTAYAAQVAPTWELFPDVKSGETFGLIKTGCDFSIVGFA